MADKASADARKAILEKIKTIAEAVGPGAGNSQVVRDLATAYALVQGELPPTG